MNHIFTLSLIMVTCGVIGGAASYVSSEIPPEENHPLVKRLILGIAASFVVPLFLNMISSSIIKDADQSQINYLVFAGFCILAAFSSKGFLSSLSKKLIDRVDAIQEKQEEIVTEIDPLLAKETEPEPDTTATINNVDIDEEELTILNALNNNKYLRRYVNGLVSETGYSDVRVSYLLLALRDKGFVQTVRGDNKDLFWLTTYGRNYVVHKL